MIVTLAEASIGIFVKLVDGQIPIWTLNFFRVFFATLTIAPLLWLLRRESLRFPDKNWRDILLIGALIATQISLFNLAMTLAPVANVVVFWSVAPFFVFIFSSLFLHERPHWSYAFVFLVALIGIVIAEPISFGQGNWTNVQLGNALALVTGAVYAALVTYLRSEGRSETRVDIFWSMLAASVYLLPGAFLYGFGSAFAASSTTMWGAELPVLTWAVGLGVFSTGFSFFFISLVLRQISANIYSLIDIIVSPIIAAFLAWLIFTESPSQDTVLGGALLLTAGAILTLLRNQGNRVERAAVVRASR
jgi:drug/metabolite transporter (DMT)-like permease